MPYTLAKFLLWGLLMGVAGGVIGWLLRSLSCRIQLAGLRAQAVDRDELERLRAELAEARASAPHVDRPVVDEPTADPAPHADSPPASADEPDAPLDLQAAAAVLGRSIKLDDLTVLDGIGPKTAKLCKGIGVTTWRQLAATDVARLQTMLDEGGPRFRMHRPTTWPQQAGLLADGRWAEFQQLTDEHGGAS